jgi:type I restriction enzyme, S subunit
VSEENELPEGWISTSLEDICTIIMGQSPPSSEYNENGKGLPFFQGKAEFTDLFPEVRKWCTAPTKIAEANDILLSIRAPVGPTNLAPSLCCIGRGLAAIRPKDEIQVRYVLYAIRTFNSNLTQLGTGSTFEAVSGDIVRAFEIPLAPLVEQKRIVDAIEQQFTRLAACRRERSRGLASRCSGARPSQ